MLVKDFLFNTLGFFVLRKGPTVAEKKFNPQKKRYISDVAGRPRDYLD